MNRNSAIYRIAKKCENPTGNNRYWYIFGLLYNSALILFGRIIIRRSMPSRDGNQYLIIPVFSNGDIALFYRVLELLKSVNGLQNPCIVMSGGCAVAARCLGFSNIRIMKEVEILAISKTLLFQPQEYRNVVYGAPWNCLKYCEINGLDGVHSIPCELSDNTKNYLDGIKESNRRLAILSPYEQSFISLGERQLPLAFWTELVEALENEGFVAVTNCDGEKDLPIPGTKSFFPGFSELAGAVDYAGYCVSVRSGFTDWSSSAKQAKHVILYPSDDFFNLGSMNRIWGDDSMYEIVYGDTTNYHDLVYRIIEYFAKG